MKFFWSVDCNNFLITIVAYDYMIMKILNLAFEILNACVVHDLNIVFASPLTF